VKGVEGTQSGKPSISGKTGKRGVGGTWVRGRKIFNQRGGQKGNGLQGLTGQRKPQGQEILDRGGRWQKKLKPGRGKVGGRLYIFEKGAFEKEKSHRGNARTTNERSRPGPNRKKVRNKMLCGGALKTPAGSQK